MDSSSNSEAALQKTILALEDRRCTAMIACDIQALERLIADDLIYVHGSSRTDDKASFIASIRSGVLKFERIDRNEVKIRISNATAAIVTGRARNLVNSKGEAKEILIRYTNVWTRPDARSDDWKFTTWQATKIS